MWKMQELKLFLETTTLGAQPLCTAAASTHSYIGGKYQVQPITQNGTRPWCNDARPAG